VSAVIRALVLSLALLGPGVAHAQTTCPETDVPDAEVTRRLEWIEARLADTEVQVRHWYTGFIAFQSVLLGVNLVLAFAAVTDDDLYDPIVSGFGAAVGLSTILIFTPPVLGSGDALRALPRGSPEERLSSLRIAERRLRVSGEAALDLRSDLSGILSALYTEAAALTLLFLGETVSAFLQAAGGMFVGLGRILLHPMGAATAWRIYRSRHPEAGCDDDPIPAARTAASIAFDGRGVRVDF
jgi:hypothetical protein